MVITESVVEGANPLRVFGSPVEYEKNQSQAGWYFDDEAGELYVRLAGTSLSDISVAINQ